MSTFTKVNAVEYLVKVKYPNPLSAAHLEPESYRQKLMTMNDNDVGILYNEVSSKERRKEEEKEKAKQEAILKEKLEEDRKFYSQPHMIADLSYWSKMATWDMECFIALAFGKEPKFINWDNIKHIKNSHFVIQYSKLRELVLNTLSTNALSYQDKPINFINWAKHNDIDLPDTLEELVNKYSPYHDWEAEYRKLQKEINKSNKETKIVSEPKLKPDKNESQAQRKINNLLKILYYMAEDKYGHKEGDERATANKLEALSGNSAQTIQGWLQDSAFLIQDDK
jgi:hypothetical protein